MSGTLVVGASQAGVQLAASLRELGDQEPITLVGNEDHEPYQRPPLSKAFLADGETKGIRLRTAQWYDDMGIHLRTGTRVTDIDPDAAGQGVATTDEGPPLHFDRLALTVGARPRRLGIPGAHVGGVCYLRDLDDARQLRTLLDRASDVVVIGGGYIGLEGAAVARSRGARVTVVEAASRLAPRSMPTTLGHFFHEAHTRRGTRVLVGRHVVTVQEHGDHVSGVVLDDGSELTADLVLVGTGVEPRTELAAGLGVTCDGGIVVDETARTNREQMVAAGDCTVFPHHMAPTERVRLESVHNAQAQARVAAATLLGQESRHESVPWFWSDQDSLKLQTAGFAGAADTEVLRGDPASESFSLLHLVGDRLVGIDAVNRPLDFMDAKRALATGVTVRSDSIHDVGLRLRDLLDPVREYAAT